MTAANDTAAVNADSGELALELEGVRYGLRPSFDALAAIEEETGKGLVDLTRVMLTGSAHQRDVAVVATECIRAWGRSRDNTNAAGANVTMIGRLILTSDGGIVKVMATLGGLLSLAVTGGITPAGEVKAAATTSTTN